MQGKRKEIPALSHQQPGSGMCFKALKPTGTRLLTWRKKS